MPGEYSLPTLSGLFDTERSAGSSPACLPLLRFLQFGLEPLLKVGHILDTLGPWGAFLARPADCLF